MNDENTTAEKESVKREVWPRMLNKVLIGAGVLTFGLIIADRLFDMFRAEEMPDVAGLVLDSDSAPQESNEPKAAAEPLESETAETQETVDVGVLAMEEVFGAQLVFVSASEPLYVVTDDDRRIDVGDTIDEQTKLAGITGQGVIVDKSGELLVVRLPDPVVE